MKLKVMTAFFEKMFLNMFDVCHSGLLAGLWEFPSSPLDVSATDKNCRSALNKHLDNNFHIQTDKITRQTHIGEASISEIIFS